MATKDDVSNITTAFHTSFPNGGFLILNSDCQVESMGEVLINYKGLKIVKFDRSELKEGDYDPVKFNNMCHARCKGPNPAQEMKQLYQELKEEFPFLQICVVNGDNYQATGQLTLYKKGPLSVYIY